MKNILILVSLFSYSMLIPSITGLAENPSEVKIFDTDQEQFFTTDTTTEQLENKETLEIERKFLIPINNIPTELPKQTEIFEVIQTYINNDPEIRVRQIDHKNTRWYMFTLKIPKDEKGLSRSEIEFEISQETYQDLVKKRIATAIQKTRFQFLENGHKICLDIYRNDALKGLATAEVEFGSTDEAASFIPPKWFGKDVTSDKRFKNAHLARYGKPN